eukprot:2612118-Pleurochrysis_carterae.AAC.1
MRLQTGRWRPAVGAPPCTDNAGSAPFDFAAPRPFAEVNRLPTIRDHTCVAPPHHQSSCSTRAVNK